MGEIFRWGTGILTLFGFGLAMGLNPTLYAATADMLARNVKVSQRLAWMLIGLAAGATVLLFIFHSFDPTNIVAAFRGRVDAALVNRTVDVVVAAAFIISAVLVIVWKIRAPALRAKSPKTSKTPKTSKPRSSAYGYFFLGISACIGFTTLPIMYLTARLITTLTTDVVLRPVAYGIFLIGLAAPFVALVWVWSRMPTLTERVTGFYAKAMAWDYRGALMVLLLLAAVLFLGLAVFGYRGL